MAPIRDVKKHRLGKPRRCLICPIVFEPNSTWQRFCSAGCRDRGSTMRKRIALAEWICHYCGEIGDTIDHIPPVSRRPTLLAMGLQREYPFIEVRACLECNCALCDQAFWTVTERKRYIKIWLVRRYGRLLGMPEWTPDELLDLGPGLVTYVSSGIYKKRVIERRIKW